MSNHLVSIFEAASGSLSLISNISSYYLPGLISKVSINLKAQCDLAVLSNLTFFLSITTANSSSSTTYDYYILKYHIDTDDSTHTVSFDGSFSGITYSYSGSNTIDPYIKALPLPTLEKILFLWKKLFFLFFIFNLFL